MNSLTMSVGRRDCRVFAVWSRKTSSRQRNAGIKFPDRSFLSVFSVVCVTASFLGSGLEAKAFSPCYDGTLRVQAVDGPVSSAHSHYLSASDLVATGSSFLRRPLSRLNAQQAKRNLEAALEINPNHSLGKIALARTLLMLIAARWSEDEENDVSEAQNLYDDLQTECPGDQMVRLLRLDLSRARRLIKTYRAEKLVANAD